jgi:hypothetical protein
MAARSKREVKISNALLKPWLPQFAPKIAYLHDALYAPESAQIHTGLVGWRFRGLCSNGAKTWDVSLGSL